MKLLNLNEIADNDASWYIKKIGGGKYHFIERLQKKGIGIGGLFYVEGFSLIDENRVLEDPLRANLEVFRDGFGVYLRNSREHYLLIIPTQELKQADLFYAEEQNELTTAKPLSPGAEPTKSLPILHLNLCFDGALPCIQLKCMNMPKEPLSEKLSLVFGVHRFTDFTK